VEHDGPEILYWFKRQLRTIFVTFSLKKTFKMNLEFSPYKTSQFEINSSLVDIGSKPGIKSTLFYLVFVPLIRL
jgi:hypothetical protein